MRYIYMSLLTLFLVIFAVVVPSADAQTAVSNNTALEVQIAELMEQVATLQAQIKVLESTNVSLESEVGQLRLEARLSTGSTGKDVLLLQEFLATDPTIYPEGLITGFFGSLTENAVKRFQAKLKLEQVGVVGPQTLAKINEILVAAGVTGDIPSDFLGSRVKIEVKAKNGELEIKMKCNSSGTGNICNDDEDDDNDDKDDDGDDGEDGQDGKDGLDGVDGKDGDDQD